jgi:hypothetical protein
LYSYKAETLTRAGDLRGAVAVLKQAMLDTFVSIITVERFIAAVLETYPNHPQRGKMEEFMQTLSHLYEESTLPHTSKFELLELLPQLIPAE